MAPLANEYLDPDDIYANFTRIPLRYTEDITKHFGLLFSGTQCIYAKIQITITMVYIIRINYPLSSFNYCLSGTNVANFNNICHIVSEQQLFKKWNSKTEFSNMENTD